MALLDRASMPKIADLAEPMLRLAGSRINPKTNGPHNPASILGITLKKIADGVETKVVLPANVRLSAPGFSPDGKWLSFMVYRANGIELWMADMATAKAKAVTSATINGLGGCSWLAGQFGAALPFRRGRSRARSRAAGGAHRAPHPGEHRQGRAGRRPTRTC